MSKIRMDPDNLFPWPKGAFIGNKKSGVVYINISNAYVKPENKKKAPGTRGYTGHRTKCIGKVADPSAREHAFSYANDAYRRDFLHLDVPELPDPPRLNDSVTAGLHVWISEASAASGLRRDLAEAFGEEDAREILDLAQYMISGKSALMEHYPAWGRDHMIFSSEILDCAEIGSFLKKRLTRSRIRKFQLKWAERSLSGSEDAVLLCSDAVHENGQAQGADLVKEDPPLEDPFLSFSHTDYAIRQSDGMPVAYLHAPGPLPGLREAQEIEGLLGEWKSKPDDSDPDLHDHRQRRFV